MATIGKEVKIEPSRQKAEAETHKLANGCIAAATCKMAAFCGGNCNDKLKSEKQVCQTAPHWGRLFFVTNYKLNLISNN